MLHDHPPRPKMNALCDLLGRREIAARVDRTPAAVTNAVAEGVFPPAWFAAVEAMCIEKGVHCPRELFRFIGSETNEAPE